MFRKEIEHGKRHICRVLDQLQNLHGAFVIRNGEIEASLTSFEGSISLDADHPIFLQLEDLSIVSLYWNFDTKGYRVGLESTVDHRMIISNLALIGDDTWCAQDLVKRATLRVPTADALFKTSELYKKIMKSDFLHLDMEPILITKTPDFEVHLTFTIKGDGYHDNPTAADPIFELRFEHGVKLLELLRAVTCLEQFISCLSGKVHYTDSLTISRYSESDIEERLEREEPVSGHILYRYYDKNRATPDYLSLYETAVNLISPDSRQVFDAALYSWIENYSDIEVAASYMMRALQTQNILSSDRLLNAWKWFESIPVTKPRRQVKKEDARAVGKLVSAELRKMGYEIPVADRAASAVSKVSLESNRDRFQRLVDFVKEGYGESIIDQSMVDWLLAAYAQRGPAAHGVGNVSSTEFDLMELSIDALEAMCTLLLLDMVDLPVDERARVGQHPLLDSYNRGARHRIPK